MRGAFVYRRVPGSLGSARPWIAAVYLLPLALIAFTFSSPLVLAGTGLAAVGVALLAGVPEAVRTPLRWALPLVAMVVLVNGLVAQRGATILFRFGDLPLLGPTNLTLEALAEGAVLGGRIVVSLIVFAIWSACVDPDRILRGMRPLARHSALTATLISRLVPLAAEDVRRLGEAAQLRGPAAAPVGKSAIARRMIAGALERSVDVAATLELRGYALGGTRRLVRNRRARGEGPLLVAGLATLVAAAGAWSAGGGGFSAYPTIEVDTGIATILVAVVIPLLAAAPLLLERATGRRGG